MNKPILIGDLYNEINKRYNIDISRTTLCAYLSGLSEWRFIKERITRHTHLDNYVTIIDIIPESLNTGYFGIGYDRTNQLKYISDMRLTDRKNKINKLMTDAS